MQPINPIINKTLNRLDKMRQNTVKCPKCGLEWTKLTKKGICCECEEKVKITPIKRKKGLRGKWNLKK